MGSGRLQIPRIWVQTGCRYIQHGLWVQHLDCFKIHWNFKFIIYPLLNICNLKFSYVVSSSSSSLTSAAHQMVPLSSTQYPPPMQITPTWHLAVAWHPQSIRWSHYLQYTVPPSSFHTCRRVWGSPHFHGTLAGSARSHSSPLLLEHRNGTALYRTYCISN